MAAKETIQLDEKTVSDRFGVKASMIPGASVEELVGHAPGGVCPFGIREGVEVWLDASLKLYETVHLACGDDRTTIEFTPDETEQASGAQGWVDVTKLIEPKA